VPDGDFLELRGVEKRFGATLVLRGIDLAVGEHEVVSLIGASGSGKSTLLRCVNALEPIDAGTVSVEGKLVSGPGVDVDRHRREVGIVFQSFNLFPHMTVLQNITLAPRQVLRLSRREAEERADALL
jgi:polar amino acid transport system ATP-binding protein